MKKTYLNKEVKDFKSFGTNSIVTRESPQEELLK